MDEGAMYRWVLRDQDRLCPGACWTSERGSQATTARGAM